MVAEPITDAPLVYDWTRHELQAPFIYDDRRFLVWVGGRGSTKTASACFHWMERIQDPAWAGARFILAGPISKQMKEGPLYHFDEWFDPTGLTLRKLNGNDPRRFMVNDIEILCFNVGLDGGGSEAWRGLEVAGVWLDEAAQMPEKAFNLANAACRQRRRDGTSYPYQTILTTTPRGQNWLHRRFLDDRTRPTYKNERGEPIYTDETLGVYRSTTLQSVEAGFLDLDYVGNIGHSPGTRMYEQEVLGNVVSWAGLVFPYYHPEQHTPKPFVMPNFTRVVGGVDIGVTVSQTAIELIGIDADNRYWVFKEYYERGGNMSQWLPLCKLWAQQYNVRNWFVDAAFPPEIRTMRAAGLQGVRPSIKSKDAAGTAVNRVNDLMSREVEGRGPRLMISPECVGLIGEMLEYEYKDKMSGDEVTFLHRVKPGQADHAIDAFRYAIYGASTTRGGDSAGQWADGSFG